ncbi:Hypothetical predicted protein [Marmota monax]|uniref:Uncharacterized protein n=1 Tax=Marmota monax TaxID=9995 RepID=A0A5E4CTN7_MARMO|nr:hypothetical protein GHT09_015321 [Marmota monax]VTJ84519.1 Hypothetical predicted protein [Marmota monax]
MVPGRGLRLGAPGHCCREPQWGGGRTEPIMELPPDLGSGRKDAVSEATFCPLGSSLASDILSTGRVWILPDAEHHWVSRRARGRGHREVAHTVTSVRRLLLGAGESYPTRAVTLLPRLTQCLCTVGTMLRSAGCRCVSAQPSSTLPRALRK